MIIIIFLFILIIFKVSNWLENKKKWNCKKIVINQRIANIYIRGTGNIIKLKSNFKLEDKKIIIKGNNKNINQSVFSTINLHISGDNNIIKTYGCKLLAFEDHGFNNICRSYFQKIKNIKSVTKPLDDLLINDFENFTEKQLDKYINTNGEEI